MSHALGMEQATNSTYIYIDFFNNIQPARDAEWTIADDESHNKDNLWVKIFAEHSKHFVGNC